MRRTLLTHTLALVILSACGPATTPLPPTNTPQLISECLPYYKVQVWIDQNADGVADPEEPPLAGVSVAMYPLGQSSSAFYGQTRSDGIVEINGIGDFGRHCDDLEVEVTVPPGYSASTPARIGVSGHPAGDTLQFGLIPPAPTAAPQAAIDPRLIASLYPPMDPLPIDGCPFAGSALFEKIVGRLTRPLLTTVIVLPPYYNERASVRCQAQSQNDIAYVDVWFAPDREAARADYDAIGSLVGDEAIAVGGLGEAAWWWPRGLRLEAVHGDARITVSLAAPLPDSANQAAALAAAAVEVIDPAAGAVRVEPVAVPAGSSAPEVVSLRDLVAEGDVFEACSLLSQAEFEQTLGPLEYALLSASSIVELGPHVYECMTGQHESAAWMYYGLTFGETPGDAIFSYWREAASRPGDAGRVKALGDEARGWVSEDGASLNLSVLRGNVTLSMNVLMEDTVETQTRLEVLAWLVIERLFERASRPLSRD